MPARRLPGDQGREVERFDETDDADLPRRRPPKSKRSRREVALDAETVDALRRHREAQLLERDFAGDAYEDHDLVFADELGHPIYPTKLTRAFKLTVRRLASRLAACTSFDTRTRRWR
jgi:integrase